LFGRGLALLRSTHVTEPAASAAAERALAERARVEQLEATLRDEAFAPENLKQLMAVSDYVPVGTPLTVK